MDYMQKKECKVGLFQETFLKPDSQLKVANYTIVRKDRTKDKGGGVAIFVHKDLVFEELNIDPKDGHTEVAAIKIKLDNEITIANVYIPPSSSCSKGFKPNLESVLKTDSVVCGDFNGHSDLWYSEIEEDERGTLLADQFEAADMVILNSSGPTREPKNGRGSSPDITLAHSNLAMSSSWDVETALSSDHNPIVVNICTETLSIASEKKTFVNFNKADWTSFRNFVEERIKFLPAENVHKMEHSWRALLQKAMKKHIPKGRIPRIYPGFPSEAAKLAKKRDQLRKQDPTSKQITELNMEIRNTVNQHKRDKWTKHLAECDLRKGSKKLWKTIKGLSKKEERSDNIAIKFSNKTTYRAKDCANKLNQMYFPANPNKKEKEHRHIMRKLKKTNSSFSLISAEVEAAISRTKNSKALGPDELAPLILKKLGPLAVAYITKMFNCSLHTATIPSIWKKSRVIPLLKPGKPKI